MPGSRSRRRRRRLRLPRSPRRRALLALLALGAAYALVMQNLGWAQTSYFAQVKAFAHGTPTIDRYHWETRDTSWYHGHFYSVKAPGMALATLPLYLGLEAAGAERLAANVAATAHRHGPSRWHYTALPLHNYGYSAARRDAVQRQLEDQSPLVWALGLLGTVLPALALLALVCWAGERLVPGAGLPAAVTLGAGTLVLPFATQFFGHVLAAGLAFGAFCVALRERSGGGTGAPRAGAGSSPSSAGPLRRLGASAMPSPLFWSGLLAGLAITTEYPLAIAAGLVGAYAVLRGGLPWAARARRAIAYAAGGLVGVAPLAAYNEWAFSSLWHNSYQGAVRVSGYSGHAGLGLNDGGFFGIGLPSPSTALELLFSARGLLTIAPVAASAVYGLVLLHRRQGRRAEALLAGAVALAYLVYDSGYWTPFGGGTPGPRFLIPALPFLALGLAAAWRVRPALVAALTGPSAVLLLAGTLTRPLIGDTESAGLWAWLIHHDVFSNTLLSTVGLGNGWPEVLPVLACVALALGLALPRVAVGRGEVALGCTALAAWMGVAASAPALWGAPAWITGDHLAGELFAAGAMAGVVLLGAVAWRGRALASARPEESAGRQPVEHDPVPQLT
jgi:hypothetical protein